MAKETKIKNVKAEFLMPKSRPELLGRIMLRIRHEQKKASLFRAAIFSVTFSASLVALVPAFQMMQTAAVQSGFWDFLSLIFSDFDLIAVYWQNFFMTILETLPAVSLIVFLSVIFILLESLKLLFRDVRIVFEPLLNSR